MNALKIPSLEIVYLVSGVLFIIGLKFLSSPARAKTGNLLAGIGMILAVAVTALDMRIVNWTDIIIGGLIGIPIGYVSARRVKMTAIPQIVALFNGAGGGAAALVAAGEYLRLSADNATTAANLVPILLSLIIGAVSFAGSLVAFAKLQELMTGRPITYPGQQVVNGLLALAILAVAVALLAVTGSPAAITVLLALALVLGVALVLPI